jgi:hypothetical protein
MSLPTNQDHDHDQQLDQRESVIAIRCSVTPDAPSVGTALDMTPDGRH